MMNIFPYYNLMRNYEEKKIYVCKIGIISMSNFNIGSSNRISTSGQFLLAVIYGPPRRHSNSSVAFKMDPKYLNIFV